MVLPVPVTYVSDIEEPVGFASRLAAANGYRSLKAFLSSGGTNVASIARGETEAVAKLSAWSGAEPVRIAKLATVSLGDRNTWRVGEATFSRNMRRGNRFRYCPNCTTDDIEHGHGHPASRPYVRVQWLTRAVVNCTRHRRPLIEVDFPEHSENDFAQYVMKNLPLIEAQANQNFAAQSTAVDLYAEHRISGLLRQPYLDRFQAYVAIDLCSHLGRFAQRQHATWTLVPSELQGSSLREVGFYFAERGEECIRDLVVTFIRAHKPHSSEKFLFGNLGRWLRSNVSEPDYLELVLLFQDVAERNLPFGPGDLCFVPVQKRYLHSITTASVQYGLFEDRVAQLLREAGLVGHEKLSHSRIFFDAAKAHDILANAAETLTSKEARLDLGLTEGVMSDLLSNGLLPRVEVRADARTYSRIRRVDLAEFKQKILAAGSPLQKADGLGKIADVCQKCGCRASDVLALILKGTLSIVLIPSIDDFKVQDILVDPDETIRQINAARQSDFSRVHGGYVTFETAQATLRVKPCTIKYLADKGLLSAAKLSSPKSSRRKDFVTVASLEAFQRDYVTLGELAAQYEKHAITITNALERVGVKSTPEKAGHVTRFYRRVDVATIEIREPDRKRD